MLIPFLFCLAQMPQTADVPPATEAPVLGAPLEFRQALAQGWTYDAVLEETQEGDQLSVTVWNPGPATTVLLDAGLVFQGPDDIQPPVIMEDILVDVPRGEGLILIPNPGCGNAILASPGEGLAFNGGVEMLDEELARVLDRMNAGDPGLAAGRQDMVWVYTNAHDFSSVYVDDSVAGELDAILDEEVAGFEAPGYAVKYREPTEEDEGMFTGEAMEIRCELNMVLQQGEPCRVVMVQPDGERIEMMEGFALRSGPHDVTLTMAFEGYPAGAYQLRVEGMRSGLAHFEREVTLQGRT